MHKGIEAILAIFGGASLGLGAVVWADKKGLFGVRASSVTLPDGSGSGTIGSTSDSSSPSNPSSMPSPSPTPHPAPAEPSTVAGCAARGVVLRLGASGPCVAAVQRTLNQFGGKCFAANFTALAEDGQFGPQTFDAVSAFQQAQGIGVDGVIGPHTWAALHNWHCPTVAPGPGVLTP